MPGEVQPSREPEPGADPRRRPCWWSPPPRTTGSSATSGPARSSPRRRRSPRRGRSSSSTGPTSTAAPPGRRPPCADGRVPRLRHRRRPAPRLPDEPRPRSTPSTAPASGGWPTSPSPPASRAGPSTRPPTTASSSATSATGATAAPSARPIVGDDLSTIPRVFPTNGLRLIKWTPDQTSFRPEADPDDRRARGATDVAPELTRDFRATRATAGTQDRGVDLTLEPGC